MSREELAMTSTSNGERPQLYTSYAATCSVRRSAYLQDVTITGCLA